MLILQAYMSLFKNRKFVILEIFAANEMFTLIQDHRGISNVAPVDCPL